MHLQGSGPLDEITASGADGLIPDEHDAVAFLGQEVLQVVHDASTGSHPRGRDDDARRCGVVQLLGLKRGAGLAKSRDVEQTFDSLS